MLPGWLLSSEGYLPRPDRDAFIDRSIGSVLRLLARFRGPGSGSREMAAINPGVRLGSTLLLIVLVSVSHKLLFLSYSGALLLVALSFCSAELILKVLKTSLPIGAFTLVVMLPSALWGNTVTPVTITLKVLLSVVAVNLFIATAAWESVLGGLRVFMPRLFVLVLDVTTRYLVLLGELSLTLLNALKLRSVGHNAAKASALGGIAGTLFVRSRLMAEELYAAMECRCFTGGYPRGSSARLSAADLLPAGLDALSIAMFVLAGAR